MENIDIFYTHLNEYLEGAKVLFNYLFFIDSWDDLRYWCACSYNRRPQKWRNAWKKYYVTYCVAVLLYWSALAKRRSVWIKYYVTVLLYFCIGWLLIAVMHCFSVQTIGMWKVGYSALNIFNYGS